MRNLSPSEKLLRKYKTGAISWGEFSRKYRKELGSNSESEIAIREVLTMSRKGPVTLLCFEREGQRCHRQILKKLLETRRTR